MPLRSRTARAVLALASLALVAAACGDDDDTGTVASEAGDTDPTATTAVAGAGAGGAYSEPGRGETTAPAAPAAESAVTVEVVDSDLGSILATGDRTVYIFMPDGAGAPTCYDDCATTWPPLLADGDPTAGTGLDAGLLATVARDDGGEQVTIDGWPLYLFAGDAAPGDVNGQGVAGVWFVVGPDGVPIEAS